MIKHTLLILFSLFQLLAISQNKELYQLLDNEIKNEPQYNLIKEQKLDSLKLKIIQNSSKGKEWEQYKLYKTLADEYATYTFDSAMHYYRGAINRAYKMNHKNAIAECQSDYGHLLVSVGYYKEAIDSLNKVTVYLLNKHEKQDHFSYLTRAYYDLADYINDDFYAPQYRATAESYVDSVLYYQVTNTVQPIITKALRFLARWQPDSAKHYYNLALTKHQLTLHQQAVVNSCLGFIYLTENKQEQGEQHLIQSTIADIKTSTKEAISLMVLARYLYEQGDISRAYKYILKAKSDASFFGSQQRKLQVAEIFPSIEGAKLVMEERKKEKAVKFIWLVSTFTLVVVIILIIIYKQLFNLRKIWTIINRNNKELKLLNTQLQEANKIKEKYIGHFFNTGSMYIHKIEEISKAVNALLASNNTQKLKTVLRKINPKKERDLLFHNFDDVFLKLFPTFINDVNAVVAPEEQYILKPGQLLNTELRILALIRLGVEDNETMAQVLGISINTIYTYKTKAQNKSTLSTELFFEKLKEIKSV